MDLKLSGKKVFITGATRGIGLSIAKSFAQEGCAIALCARDEKGVDNTISTLKKSGVNAIGTAVDITDHHKFKTWLHRAAKQLGGFDIYVTNVSAQSFEWEKSFEVDILACVKGVEVILPFLKKSNCGSIVAIASKAALLSVPSYKAYSAMKAALISYMSSLSRELAKNKIRVNTISPGEIYFKGGFWERIKHEDPELYKQTLQKNILGRFGVPEDVAKAVVFLASPVASFISGTNVLIDGASHEHVQF